jgi:hypothetical protein
LLQSVACGMAIMPLGCGFVGVVGHRGSHYQESDPNYLGRYRH